MSVMMAYMHKVEVSTLEEDVIAGLARGMEITAGYALRSDVEIDEREQSLVVGACGRYRITTRDHFVTDRKSGRKDFQLLYVAQGSANFIIDGVEREVSGGNFVIYYPNQPQYYEYVGAKKPVVYWVHFSGVDAQSLAESAGFSRQTQVLQSGAQPQVEATFERIINELQVQQKCFEQFCQIELARLFALIQRYEPAQGVAGHANIPVHVRDAITYFHAHASDNLLIEDYAHASAMSVSWFIRQFREFVGESPKQYITRIRLNEAKMLLESTDYSIGHVARMVGYDNPLYFSRVFTKYMGLSPRDYRRSRLT